MKISDALLKQIERHGEADFPREACGLLVGTSDTIAEAVPSRNLAASENEFLIDPALQLKLQRELRGTGRRIVGVYHSHPSGDSAPSDADKTWARAAGLVWLITPVADGRAGVSRLFSGASGESGGFNKNFIEQRLQTEKKVA